MGEQNMFPTGVPPTVAYEKGEYGKPRSVPIRMFFSGSMTIGYSGETMGPCAGATCTLWSICFPYATLNGIKGQR